MKLIISLFILLFILVSCSNEEISPLNKPVLTNNGVNTLNSHTPFKLNSITPNLLGYDIDIFSAFKNGSPISIMRVSYYSKEVMFITPTQIANNHSGTNINSIIITSNYVKNPWNLQIGDHFKEDLFSKCETKKGELFCSDNNFKNIKIVFSKQAENLYTLKEFIWSENANY